EPAGVAKHVRVDRKWHLGGFPEALDKPVEADRADWPAALGNEHVGIFGVIAPQLAERPHLVTANRVHAGNPILDTVNVQAALGQLDLLPLQVADLRGPQTVAISDQDHGRVAMAVAAKLAGAVHQPVDLALGEVAPLDCQVYDAWLRFLDVDFMRITFACASPTVYVIRLFWTVVKGGAAAWSASRSQCRMEAPG